jgi:Helix-turn-helix domain
MSAIRKTPPAGDAGKTPSQPAVLYGPSLPKGIKRVKQASPSGPPLDPSFFDALGGEKPKLFYYPEYSDGNQIKALFGFSRATAYNLLSAGKIKSVTFREKGKLRGKRLFSCESIRQFLARCEE